MFGEHYESLPPQGKYLCFAEFKMDYTKYKKSRAGGGLQYLIHLDVYYQHFEIGLGLETMTEDERGMTTVDHWNLHGFSYYVLQYVRGLVEGPAAPYYKHLEGVRYIHEVYMDLMIGDQYKLTSVPTPDHSPPQYEHPAETGVRTGGVREGPAIPT